MCLAVGIEIEKHVPDHHPSLRSASGQITVARAQDRENETGNTEHNSRVQLRLSRLTLCRTHSQRPAFPSRGSIAPIGLSSSQPNLTSLMSHHFSTVPSWGQDLRRQEQTAFHPHHNYNSHPSLWECVPGSLMGAWIHRSSHTLCVQCLYCTYLCLVNFNLKHWHSKRLASITNNKIEPL